MSDGRRDSSDWGKAPFGVVIDAGPHLPKGTVMVEVGEKATPLDTPTTRPDYYGGADDPYEPIKVLEAWLTPEEFRGWLKGTILKYIRRCGHKGQNAGDIAKAAWYSRYLSEWEKRQETK